MANFRLGFKQTYISKFTYLSHSLHKISVHTAINQQNNHTKDKIQIKSLAMTFGDRHGVLLHNLHAHQLLQ